MARLIESDSLANQNISAATAVGAYTADAARIVYCRMLVDQVAGSGDYVAYLTVQRGGAGSSYVMLGKTTGTAAAGETAIGFMTIPVAVNTGDVVTAYIDGLAGDIATPDTVVDWFEGEPVTVGALANDVITAAAFDEATAFPLTSADTGATAVARTGADADTLETLSDQIDAVATALNQCTVTVVAGVTGDTITVVPYTTWEFTISGLATLSGAAVNGVLFTVKNRATDSDADAILQVQEGVGLVRLNGAAGTAAKGTLVVAGSETALTVHVNASQTGGVAPGTLYWDVKQIVTTAEDADQMASGVFEVRDPAVTRTLVTS